MSRRIRTAEDLYDVLVDDLAWRRKELIYFNSKIKPGDEFEKILLRSSVALLYAHWEGCIKIASRSYLKFIASKNLKMYELRPELAALSLRRIMGNLQPATKATVHAELIRTVRENSLDRANIPTDSSAIRTESNLSSPVLEEILSSIGCDYEPYRQYSDLIDDQLVSSRNSIAHGDNSYIRFTEWEDLYKTIMWMLDDIQTQIVNGALIESYLAPRPTPKGL